jgi:hypothetical protein
MGATAGTKTPLAGQARAQQQQSSFAPGVRDDAYYNQMRKDFSKAVATGGGNVDDAERSFDKNIAAVRQVEKSRNTGVPLTQTPPGGVDDYYTPDNLRRDYESANPGKNFEGFLSSAEDQYGREAMAPVRSGLTSRPAPQPARRPSRFGIKSFR